MLLFGVCYNDRMRKLQVNHLKDSEGNHHLSVPDWSIHVEGETVLDAVRNLQSYIENKVLEIEHQLCCEILGAKND